MRGYGLPFANGRSCSAAEPALELLDSPHRRVQLVAEARSLARVREVEQYQDGQSDERGEARVSAGGREEVGDRKSEGEMHFRLA